MTAEPEDFREWMRFQMTRSDRVLREILAEHRREMDAMLARNDRSFSRSEDSLDRAVDRMVTRFDDQDDERRSLIEALMKLIDRIDRWDPGGAAA